MEYFSLRLKRNLTLKGTRTLVRLPLLVEKQRGGRKRETAGGKSRGTYQERNPV